MTTQSKKPSSIFPDFPREQPMVDEQGNLKPQWKLQLNALFQALQKNFKNEGIVFPSLSASDIATIQALYAVYIGHPLPQSNPLTGQTFLPDISGQTVFDSTNRVPKQFIITFDGATPPNVVTAAWKTFTLT